jgi:hypothetical protein
MTIDGVMRSPLVTDYDRFRRVIVQSPTAMSFQRMDDTFASFGAKVDVAGKSIVLTRSPAPGTRPGAAPPPAEAGRLAFDRPAGDRLVLDGTMEGKAVRLELRSFDMNTLRLLQRRFRWVQDFPFNR